MIRVQFSESISGINFNYGRGGYYTLPTSEAEYYIRKGMAKAAPEDNKSEVKAEVRPLKNPKSKAKRVSTRPVK